MKITTPFRVMVESSKVEVKQSNFCKTYYVAKKLLMFLGQLMEILVFLTKADFRNNTRRNFKLS